MPCSKKNTHESGISGSELPTLPIFEGTAELIHRYATTNLAPSPQGRSRQSAASRSHRRPDRPGGQRHTGAADPEGDPDDARTTHCPPDSHRSGEQEEEEEEESDWRTDDQS